MTSAVLLSCLVVFLTHTLEAVTGFGCTVLAVPFITALLGIKTAVISLTTIGWLLALYFAVTKRKQINFKQYLIITGCMLLGLPIGIYLFRKIEVSILRTVLAVFICAVSVVQLFKLLINKRQEKPLSRKGRIPYYFILFAGGIIHGMFSSGGPFAVLYASRLIKDKGAFRATMCLLWTTLNAIIIAGYFLDKSFTAENGKIIACFIPPLLAGIFAGEKIHDKVNARVFSILVFSVLLLTGVVMLVSK